MPLAVGVPFIVTVFDAQLPDTPEGKPLKVAPVAPVVLYVILVKGVLIHRVWLSVPAPEDNAIVLSGLTVMENVCEEPVQSTPPFE